LLRNFFFKTLWIVIVFPPWFLFCYNVSPHVFFLNYLCRFFFNIELVENSALTFPTCFFFHFFFLLFFQNCLLLSFFSFFCFFFKIVFVDFIFLIWSWLKI
jgi:hypothetical protein